MKKKNNVVILMGVIIAILSVLCILFATGVIDLKNNLFYDVNDLSIKINNNYKIFENISNNDNEVETIVIGNGEYSASLHLNGNVNVKKYSAEKCDSHLLNVNKVVDIVEFSVPSDYTEQLMYMLDEKGNVYSYKFGNIDSNNYNVSKVESVSNVKKLFISRANKENTGGSWALFAITKDNECVMLDVESV